MNQKRIENFLKENNINDSWKFIPDTSESYIFTYETSTLISLKRNRIRILKPHINKNGSVTYVIYFDERKRRLCRDALIKLVFMNSLHEKIIFLKKFLDYDGMLAQVPDYENYFVTDDGQVISWFNKILIMKQSKNKNGYQKVTLCKNKVKNDKYVHRLILRSFVENEDNKSQVDHINQNRVDNRLCNLRFATREENNSNRLCKGHISKTKSNTFQVQFYISPNKRRSKTFKTREEAEVFGLHQQLFREMLNRTGAFFS